MLKCGYSILFCHMSCFLLLSARGPAAPPNGWREGGGKGGKLTLFDLDPVAGYKRIQFGIFQKGNGFEQKLPSLRFPHVRPAYNEIQFILVVHDRIPTRRGAWAMKKHTHKNKNKKNNQTKTIWDEKNAMFLTVNSFSLKTKKKKTWGEGRPVFS